MAFNIDAYLPMVRSRESGGNDYAQNPRSSAGGRYQFIDSTFLNYGRRLWPGESDSQIMARKMDPNAQEQAMRAFTNDNVGILSQAGIPLTNGSVYGAHFLGPQGATQLYQSDDAAPVASVVGQGVVDANPFLAGKTVADTKAWLEQKGAGQSGGGGVTAAPKYSSPGGSVSPDAQANAGGGGIMSGLFGNSEGGGWSLPDGLMMASIAAMSRDNPQGAAALAAMYKTNKEAPNKARKLESQYDPKTGRLLQIDPTTGAVTVKELGAQKVEDAPSPEVIRKESEDFIKHDESIQRASKLAERTNYFRQALAEGKLRMDLVSQGGNALKTWLNSSDENSRLYNEFNAYKEELRNFQLLAQKGVQTEGDATRAMNQFFPQGSTFDDKTVLTRLNDLGSAARKDVERLYGYQKDILARTGKVKADGGVQYKADTEGRIKSLNEWEDNFGKTFSTPPANSQTSESNARTGGSDAVKRFQQWQSRNK